MIVFPNAKINIGLNVIAKRADGYHNLETIFYPVKIYDALEAITAPVMHFASSGINIPGGDEKNLCIKAYELVSRDHPLPRVNIHLHKHIPIGAGLGGGSADAAFFLKQLNTLSDLNLSDDDLENYARQLGADCAFFIRNKPVYATQKGDVFKEAELDLTKYYLVVAMPDVHVSTADAYSGVVAQDGTADLRDSIKLPVAEWKHEIKNDFERSVFKKFPVIEDLKNELYKAGALYASMSGSGAAVFGIFEVQPNLSHLEKSCRIFYKV
ncbi:4-(cytidine 5'-diphospho)-2-C-methyl-D-erythritol kinase [Mucilaginibacter ginkgonis]|uniref:4-diphosphocytidyl-2-C-methyl-D-erythritol kinase n=1 Tax=Mucilaginibacter ginkgonis TaxID=2682091 RepID=A0A6I4I7A3_9SPHI|nr:4-(cytidine 5'-diphospho)-2-C-methyl-D-erythritol kinase [Mucilaginibacter ginkgonis]QQL50700.1 4-(cytidine 5'-diphospho)-2-C-methyl-D-erythritol kinase [Mucilaginibacter ginkgonis]